MPEGAMLSPGDARLEIWGPIREAGFIEESGFPPENIAFYRRAAEMIAGEEVRFFLEGSAECIAEDRAAVMLETYPCSTSLGCSAYRRSCVHSENAVSDRNV